MRMILISRWNEKPIGTIMNVHDERIVEDLIVGAYAKPYTDDMEKADAEKNVKSVDAPAVDKQVTSPPAKKTGTRRKKPARKKSTKKGK